MWVPVGNGKWINIELHIVEERYMLNCSDVALSRFILKYAEVVDEASDEEIAEEVRKVVKMLIEDGYSINEIVERAMLILGIPEIYIRGMIDRVMVELGLLNRNGMLVK
ncbi:hypothetical protein DRP05_13920 [Archaeoglobales archaeon]|nr:MAG: hypothetical protein DRP05_13920 [Archaeoglobales archaeon]